MLNARVILLTVLVVVNVTAISVWITMRARGAVLGRPAWTDGAIGCVTSFLDTLGIGSYAQITAVFKLRGSPDDALIPGTLNVGSFVPSFVGSLLFFGAFGVEPVLLASMVISAGVGAWLGSGLVSRMPRRTIQLFMGVALLIAAFFFAMTALNILPPSGTAMGLTGARFVIAVVANGLFGALMCIGIGNYAPCMVLLGLLGMHPIAAYPIMFLSDGVLIPVAAIGFLRSKRFSHGNALGVALGGVFGVLCAFPLVKLISKHLSLMRWVVIGVILYAAVSMLRSARNRNSDAAPGAENRPTALH